MLSNGALNRVPIVTRQHLSRAIKQPKGSLMSLFNSNPTSTSTLKYDLNSPPNPSSTSTSTSTSLSIPISSQPINQTSTSTSTSISTSNLIFSELRDSISPASNDNDIVGGRADSSSYTNNLNFLRQNTGAYDNTTLLIDIRPEHFGIFTGISPSLTFIPEKFIKKTRTVWSTRMQMLLDDGSDINWKKLILLPLILFDCNRNESLTERKRKYGIRLDKLQRDDWSSFTLGSLSKKTIKTDPISQDEIHTAATRLADVGEIGKAFKKLKSDKNRIIPRMKFFLNYNQSFPDPAIQILRLLKLPPFTLTVLNEMMTLNQSL